VISWLLNAVVKDIGHSILFSAIARDVWVQLEQRLGNLLVPRSLGLQVIRV